MATVNILVTARNQANAAFAGVANSLRTVSAAGQRSAAQLRQEYDRVTQQAGQIGPQLLIAQREQARLRAESERCTQELRDMERAAAQTAHPIQATVDRLRAAQVAAANASQALDRADANAHDLARSLQRATNQAQGLNRAMNDINRGSIGNTLAMGARMLARGLASAASAASAAAPALAKVALAVVGFFQIVVPAAVAVADLTGLIQLLAPAAIAGGAAMLTLKLGMHGVSDALKAGLSGDVDAFKEALKKLSPQAAGTVKALVEIGKSWRNVRKVVQDKLFHNMGRELLDTNSAIQPLAAKWLPLISEGFNKAAAGLAALFRESAASGQLDKIMQGVEMAITGILGSIRPLSQAFLDIAEVAAPSLGQAGQSIAGMAERFAAWIRQLKEDGSLAAWLERAKSTFNEIKEGIGTAFDFIKTEVVPAIAAAQEKFEAWKAKILEVKDAMQPMIEFVKGAFQDMKKAFDDNRESIGKLGDLVKILILPVLGLFAAQVGIVVIAFKVLMEALGALGDSWELLKSAAAKAISSMLTGLAAVLSAAASAARALGMDSLAAKLDAAAGKVRGFRDSVNASLDGIRDKTVNVTVRYREVGRAVAVGPNIQQSHFGGRASGGIAGGLTMVGERGMELVRLPHGSQVYSNEDTQRMLGGGGGPAAINLTVAAARGSVGDPLAEAFLGLLRTGRLQLRAGGDPVLAARI